MMQLLLRLEKDLELRDVSTIDMVGDKRRAICFDLDGTICDVKHRRMYVASNPKNWKAWNAGISLDKPNLAVKLAYEAFSAMQSVDGVLDMIIVSGRSDEYITQTIEWLTDNGVFYDELHMRKADDHRADYIIKGEIADKIQQTHEIICVFDDRKSVVNMWVDRGIWVFDCGQGKGDF